MLLQLFKDRNQRNHLSQLLLWKLRASDSPVPLLFRFQLGEIESCWNQIKTLALDSGVVSGNNHKHNRQRVTVIFQYILFFFQMKIFDKNKDGRLDLNDLARYLSYLIKLSKMPTSQINDV